MKMDLLINNANWYMMYSTRIRIASRLKKKDSFSKKTNQMIYTEYRSKANTSIFRRLQKQNGIDFATTSIYWYNWKNDVDVKILRACLHEMRSSSYWQLTFRNDAEHHYRIDVVFPTTFLMNCTQHERRLRHRIWYVDRYKQLSSVRITISVQSLISIFDPLSFAW